MFLSLENKYLNNCYAVKKIVIVIHLKINNGYY